MSSQELHRRIGKGRVYPVRVKIALRVEEFIRRYDLIPQGGDLICLVSGGADSTCLWHVLRELGYRVSALHVNHGLRGEESEADAHFCREVLGADTVEGPPPPRPTEDALRELRYSFATRSEEHTSEL